VRMAVLAIFKVAVLGGGRRRRKWVVDGIRWGWRGPAPPVSWGLDISRRCGAAQGAGAWERGYRRVLAST
jgi:hypothetical protein